MEFEIGMENPIKIKDIELSELLIQVYVTGGFTEYADAVSLFVPSAIRKRGILIGARDTQSMQLAGIVIVVPPESSMRRLAKGNEAEMHLLAVKQEYRRHGLGRMLVESAIGIAKRNGYSKMILWTQFSMKSAQKLYETMDFIHVDDLKRNNRNFKVYEMALTD